MESTRSSLDQHGYHKLHEEYVLSHTRRTSPWRNFKHQVLELNHGGNPPLKETLWAEHHEESLNYKQANLFTSWAPCLELQPKPKIL